MVSVIYFTHNCMGGLGEYEKKFLHFEKKESIMTNNLKVLLREDLKIGR